MDANLEKPEKLELEPKPESPEEFDFEKEAALIKANVNQEAEKALAEGEEIFANIPVVDEEEKKEFSAIKEEITNLQEETQAEIEKSLDQGKETPENFIKAARVLLESLRAQEKEAEAGYVFSYDSITEKTSQGKEIKVDTLSWISDDGFATDNKRRVVLVATNPVDGKVVGLRLSDIRPDGLTQDKEKGYVNKEKVSGEILTRLRGEGIAPALDNAFVKVITKIANYYKQEFSGEHQFDWSVENANLKRLNRKKEEGLSGDELKELENEQKRWQSVYGEAGRFGFKKTDEYNYIKTIEPQLEEGKTYEPEKVDMEKYKKIEAALEECVNSQ
jgi:hypothetical protein